MMPIEIAKGVACPNGRKVNNSKLGQVRTAISTMKISEFKDSDQHFVWAQAKDVYLAAKQVGARIRTEKLNGGGFRIWRVK